MNAQEAIDNVEELKVFHEKNPKALEALSIVLESAKRLEKIKDEALSYSGIEDLDVSNTELFNFSKWVYDVSEGFEVEE